MAPATTFKDYKGFAAVLLDKSLKKTFLRGGMQVYQIVGLSVNYRETQANYATSMGKSHEVTS